MINENSDPQFARCDLADKRRTNTISDGFKIIKGKYKEIGSKKVSIYELPLLNKFGSLSEEECNVNNDCEYEEKAKYHGPRRMKRIRNSTEKNKDCLKEVNEDGGSQGEIESNSVKNIQIPVDDKQNDLRCLLLKKIYILQQSRGCKFRRIYRKKAQNHHKKSEVLSSQSLNLIKERIKQIEIHEALHEIPDAPINRKIPLQLIPYLALFICLNLDCLLKHSNLSKDTILDTARHCARKFEVKQQGTNYFFNYCNKQIHKQIGLQRKPSGPQLALIKTIVSLYDKTFYETENALQINYNETSTSDDENTPFF